jgi:Lon protease-like protein
MTQWCTTDPALKTFSGRAPLFPVPNLVLFPHSAIPLHIFEPRYRQMTADVLDGERLIAIGPFSLPAESAGEIPQPNAPVSNNPMLGVGRIVAHERLDDGRYMLVLRGVARGRLVSVQAAAGLPYHVGQIELCPDYVPPMPDFNRRTRAEEIASLYCKLFPGVEFQRLVQQALAEDLPLGSVCDVIASALPIKPEIAQLLLDERNSDLRSQMLWQLLNRMEPSAAGAMTLKPFPPDFICN